MKIELIEEKVRQASTRDVWEEYYRSTQFGRRFKELCRRFDIIWEKAAEHPGIFRLELQADALRTLGGFQPISDEQLKRLRELDHTLFPADGEEDDDGSIPAYSVEVAQAASEDCLEAVTYVRYAFCYPDGTLDNGIGNGGSYYEFWERVRLPGAPDLLFTMGGEQRFGHLIPVEPVNVIHYSTPDEELAGMHAALDTIERTPRSL